MNVYYLRNRVTKLSDFHRRIFSVLGLNGPSPGTQSRLTRPERLEDRQNKPDDPPQL
jgi:hypothetical protein